jgi:colicin import membrane protein
LERNLVWRVNIREDSRTMKAENSGLLALAELRALESNRLAQIEAAREQEARARQVQAEASQRRALEAEAQAATAQREAQQRALEQRRLLELEEQRRVDEAAVRARVEQQARLQAETLRLEQQMRAAQRAASPRWPYAVVPVLVAVLGLAGAKAWHDSNEAGRLEQSNAADRSNYDQQMAAVAGRLDALAAKQKRLEGEREELERRLSAAQSDAERQEIEAAVEEIDRQLQPTTETTTVPKSRPKTVRPKPAKPAAPPSETGPTRKPIVVGEGKDPLDGL